MGVALKSLNFCSLLQLWNYAPSSSRQVYRHWEKPVNVALTSEMLELVRKGAAPVPPRDRRRYYDLVSASLRRCPLLTNAALMDAIRAAQRELLRPPAEAA
jgi:hypothetical protein